MFLFLTLFNTNSKLIQVEILNSSFNEFINHFLSFILTVLGSWIIFKLTYKYKEKQEKERKEKERAIYYLEKFLDYKQLLFKTFNDFNLSYTYSFRKPKFNVESFDPIIHVFAAKDSLNLASDILENLEFLFVQFHTEYDLFGTCQDICQSIEQQILECRKVTNEVYDGLGEFKELPIDYSFIYNNLEFETNIAKIINNFYNIIQK